MSDSTGDESGTFSFYADANTRAEITDFEARNNYDTRTEALNDLIESGLRSKRAPMLEQWHRHSIQAAHYLMVAALVITTIGASPAGHSLTEGVWMGGIMLLSGLALLALVELARFARRANDLGELIER